MTNATTYAAGVGGNGTTTYVFSEAVTKVAFLNSAGSTESSYTEPQTVIGKRTFVADASFQIGTNPTIAVSTETAEPTATPLMAYSCSYDLAASTGRCVNEFRYLSQTLTVTEDGTLTPAATFAPLEGGTPSASSSRGNKTKVPATLAVIFATLLGYLVLVL
ncbi:hypothetical protein DL96DRAFT_1678371 [Flagelloscypha sp. PMI_526]|nr:hypothetical protein DL96DRAFT_1678371 [Flagelloscypha sp. PMI_526]